MSMPTLTVLVTGATGFIASHTVAALLAAGHRVRGTVRQRGPGNKHLLDLPGASERLELVEADLMKPGSFDSAMAGVSHVLHMASPYVLEAKDPERDLIDPAVQGTREVLAAAARAADVRRVVVTSSMAAITDEPEPDHVLTESDWNTKSTLTRNPYYLSKTLAEREAWKFVETQRPRFDLVVINPFLVIGPSLSPGLNTSNQLFVDLLAGTYPGIMNLTWGFVDVRDVALAHVRAAEVANAHGRYICANDTMTMRDLVALLAREGHSAYKLPKLGLDCAAGDFAIKLGSYFQPKGVGQYLRTHVGRTPRYDNNKIKRELQLSFLPLETSIRDTLVDLARWGHLPTGGAKS